MTDRFKEALEEYNAGLYPHTEGRFAQANFVSNETVEAIRDALTLATESEQLRKELNSAKDALELRTTCYDQLIKACRENDELRKERDELAREVSSLKDEIAIFNGENDE
jgi:uncharacterized coiled-coil DUF342 family protein